jgi:signal transduction histidine kinase
MGIRRRSSIERRLPLLMTAVLAVVLASALALTYATLRQSAVAVRTDQLQRTATLLAFQSERTMRQGIAQHAAAAADSAVVRALSSPSRAQPDDSTLRAVRAVLGRLVAPNDSGMPVELWTSDGRRIAFVGNDVRASVSEGTTPERPREIPVPHEGLDVISQSDSVQYGTMYMSGGRVHFWIVAPVTQNGRRLGYLLHQRAVAGTDQTERVIRGLTGDSLSVYLRNADGGFWTTVLGRPATPPRVDSSGLGINFVRPYGNVYLAEARVGRSPIYIVTELPTANALARPRRTIRTLLLLSLALLAGGAAAAWSIARRITRPIVSLTAAAESIATGDYAQRVEERGDDEVARLAASFNHMAQAVGSSRGALEERELQLRDAVLAAEAARGAAVAANSAKTQFLATMSHELRTPLNAIGGYAELIELGIHGPLTDDQRRSIERIRSSQRHLLGLISGVLDFGRIEAGRVAYDLAAVEVAALLEGLDGFVAPQAAAKSLALEYITRGNGLAICADRDKLMQVLLNLLSNAIRYTPVGGRIQVTADADDSRPVVRITVADTGPGIPADRLEHIFEPFVQLDRSLARPREGVGLGLAISRELARGMNGDLTVLSEIGRGSSFVITLPNAPIGAVAPPLSPLRTAVPVEGAG